MIALHEEDFPLILVMLIQMTLLVETIHDFSSISHLGMECEDDLLPAKTVFFFFCSVDHFIWDIRLVVAAIDCIKSLICFL